MEFIVGCLAGLVVFRVIVWVIEDLPEMVFEAVEWILDKVERQGIDMWNDVVGDFGGSGCAQTEWVFDIECYVWDGDMLVYEEDLMEEMELGLMVM